MKDTFLINLLLFKEASKVPRTHQQHCSDLTNLLHCALERHITWLSPALLSGIRPLESSNSTTASWAVAKMFYGLFYCLLRSTEVPNNCQSSGLHLQPRPSFCSGNDVDPSCVGCGCERGPSGGSIMCLNRVDFMNFLQKLS